MLISVIYINSNVLVLHLCCKLGASLSVLSVTDEESAVCYFLLSLELYVKL